MLTHEIATISSADFASDVRAGLDRDGQKELPSKYFYDDVGSALFEVISLLPGYGLTRADERLLRRHAAEMVNRIPSTVVVAELGSGNGKKTRWILEALSRRQATFYYPVEISPAALARCRQELADLESLSIIGVESEYLDGLREVATSREPGQHLLVLFLGSTIGNFDRGFQP
jgi:L-histidine N-alpha-methyltransferase